MNVQPFAFAFPIDGSPAATDAGVCSARTWFSKIRFFPHLPSAVQMARTRAVPVSSWLLVVAAAILSIGGSAASPVDPYVEIPGQIIASSPNPSTEFVGSPSIAVLPDGSYVASHDTFGPVAPIRTAIYRSVDGGGVWTKQAEFPAYWSNLFVHGGALYCLGTTGSYGAMVIRRSDNAGLTWSSPTSGSTGILRTEAYHTAPMPMLIHGGRIWRSFEDIGGGGGWGKQFRAFLMSAPTNADLLNSANWTFTSSLPSSGTWLDSNFYGWLEGNVLVSPAGRLVNVLRVEVPLPERAAVIDFGTAGSNGFFDPAGRPAINQQDQSGFIDFPGAAKKFTIRRDPTTGEYWSLVNPVLAGGHPSIVRNTLSLARSTDLMNWQIRCHLIFNPDRSKHGFQYADWQFEGNDLIAVVRTAWKADNYHNSNHITFHRVRNFRTLGMDDSVATGAAITWKFPGVSVTGTGFSPDLLENGRIAFANRPYTWDEVPAAFANSLVTATSGGVKASLTLRATAPVRAYLAASQVSPQPALAGWTPTGQSFCYTDGWRTRLSLFYRDLSVGEEIPVPQTNWTGTLLVIPPAPGSVGQWRCETKISSDRVADENHDFHGEPSIPPPVADSKGAWGTALRFQLGQHVDLGDVFPLTRVPFTIAFWIKINTGDISYQVPLSKQAPGSDDGYRFMVNSPGHSGKAGFVAGSASDVLFSTTPVNDGIWHHLAVTLTPDGDMILFIDGEEESRTAAPVVRGTSAALRFGATTASGVAEPLFAGWLDEIQIHHTALSAAELGALVTDPARVIAAGQPFTTGVAMSAPASGRGVNWRAVPGRQYEVYRSLNLGPDTWELQATLMPQGPTGTYLDPDVLSQAFYMVRMIR